MLALREREKFLAPADDVLGIEHAVTGDDQRFELGLAFLERQRAQIPAVGVEQIESDVRQRRTAFAANVHVDLL